MAYDDLEPHYAAVEQSFGVAGEDGANPFAAWRSSPFPMPPGDDMPMARGVGGGGRAGRAAPLPRARPASTASRTTGARRAPTAGSAAATAARSHAKGDPIAALQRALRTGRCEIRPESYASEIVLDASGRRATGVRYLDLTVHPDAPVREVRASRAVIVAAGAFETPRLLLRNGLGGDLVGRYLTYHYQTFTLGIFPEPVGGERGRSVTHLHDDLMIDTPELRAVAAAAGLPWVRGGVVEHGAANAPVEEATTYGAGRQPRRARCATARLRRRMWVFTMQGEDLPQADQPHRPRPVGARRLGPARRPGHLRPAPPRAGGVGARRHGPRGGHARRRRPGLVHRHVAAAGRARPPRRGQPARHRPGQPPRDGHGPHGHRPAARRWCPPSSGCGTSTTCWSATRRCS